MSAYKQFLSTDVIVAPLVVNKSFSFEGSISLNNNGIYRLTGMNIDPSIFLSSFLSSASFGYNSSSISLGGLYNSIKQLYYTNYILNPISGSPYITNYLNQVVEDDSLTNVYSRFYNYESTTLFQTNSLGYTSNYGYSRYFFDIPNAVIWTISIPKNLFGDYLNPNTINFKFDDNNVNQYHLLRNFRNLEEINKELNKKVVNILGTDIIDKINKSPFKNTSLISQGKCGSENASFYSINRLGMADHNYKLTTELMNKLNNNKDIIYKTPYSSNSVSEIKINTIQFIVEKLH